MYNEKYIIQESIYIGVAIFFGTILTSIDYIRFYPAEKAIVISVFIMMIIICIQSYKIKKVTGSIDIEFEKINIDDVVDNPDRFNAQQKENVCNYLKSNNMTDEYNGILNNYYKISWGKVIRTYDVKGKVDGCVTGFCKFYEPGHVYYWAHCVILTKEKEHKPNDIVIYIDFVGKKKDKLNLVISENIIS